MRVLPTLRQLRYLVALAEYRHFGRAAESCLATQSTLSAGLQELENALGVCLVERTRRKVWLTPLGETIVARARQVLQGAEDIADLAQSSATPLSGPLRLGVIPTIGPFLLPRALPALRADHPQLRLSLREDLTARLLERLGNNDLDVIIIALPYDTQDLDCLDLGEDGFALACPPDHPLAAQHQVTSQDLAQHELLLLEEGHCLRDHALAACSLPRPKAGDGVLGTSLSTLVQMVAGRLGVTLLPHMAIRCNILAGTDLVTRPVAGAGTRRLGLCFRSSSPRRAEYALLAKFLTF